MNPESSPEGQLRAPVTAGARWALPVTLSPRRVLVAWALLSACALPAAGTGGENTDPAKVVTAESCGECHVSAYEVWKKTTHATGFKTLHRKESAEAIANRMGFKLVKRDSVCIDCHYTPTLRRDQRRAVSGVSCESCHGGGRDWIDVHNDYGGKDVTHKTETPEHREKRFRDSEAAGMRRATDLYATASSCYRCHTVPNEKLVNVGRHSLGSSGFELVDWTQGEIRHNFLDSFRDGDGTVNAERPARHDRRLYVVGRALDVEYSLRGLAEATEKGVYFKAMQRRLRSAVVELRAIAQSAPLPEIDAMIAAVRSTKPRLGQRDALLATADAVAASAKKFLADHDGTRLASLDPLLEGGADAIELAEEEPEEEDEPLVAEGPRAAGEGGTAGAVPAANTTPGAGATPAVTRIDAIPAEGAKRTHIRPRSDHDTLSVTACQECHGDQNAWWFDDRHFASVDPFLERAPEATKIARLYGLSPSRMARGDSLCMDCHGTVATGRSKRPVQDGVSCQSCHGPGADFLEPHQEGDKSLGRQRPGFQKALGLGMRDLRRSEVRLGNCASCHYITDPRLISSGHPSGVDFDIVAGMQDVRHWEAELEPANTVRTAYAAVLAQRGPVPNVRLARLAQTVTQRATGGVASGTPTAASPLTALASPRPRRSRVLTPRPAGRSAGASSRDYEVPPLPEVDDSTAIEDVLKLIQDQLKKLYRIVAPPEAAPEKEE